MSNLIWRARLRLAGWLLGQHAVDVVEAYEQGRRAGEAAAQVALGIALQTPFEYAPSLTWRALRPDERQR